MADGGHHGFMPATPVDHRPWLWTAGLLSLIYSALALCAGVTSKWGMLWYDDAILAASYVFAWAHYGFLYRSVSDGLGAVTFDPASFQSRDAAQYFFISRILLLIALCLAKISVISFTRRIFSGSLYGERYIFGVSFAITTIWGVMAVLLSSVGCHPLQSLVSAENALCSVNKIRWQIITALDVLTEVLLLALPTWFVSRGQINASKKRVVIFVYSFRLFVAAFSISTAFMYFRFLQSDTARDSIGLTPTVANIEVMLCASLVSASIPSMRSFLWAFMSRGVYTMYGADSTAASGGGSQGGSIPMHSMSRTANDSVHHDADQQPQSHIRLQPGWQGYRVDVNGAGRARQENNAGDAGSLDSDGSERMIIRRNVEFAVHGN